MDNSADSLAVNYLKLGYLKQEEGKYKDACEDYLRSIEIDPNNADSYYRRGYAKEELEKYQNAIDDYTKAIQIDPNNADYYYGVYRTYFGEGRLEDATEYLNKATALKGK